MKFSTSATLILSAIALALPFSLAMEASALRLSPGEVSRLSPNQLDAYLDNAKYSQEELCNLFNDITGFCGPTGTTPSLIRKRLNPSTKKIDDWIATEMATGNFATVADMLDTRIRTSSDYPQYIREALPTAIGSNGFKLIKLFLLDPEVSVDTAIQWSLFYQRRLGRRLLSTECYAAEFVRAYGPAIQAIREGDLVGFETALRFHEIPADILNYFAEVAKAFSQEKLVDHLFVLQCDITYKSAIRAIRMGNVYRLKALLEGFKNIPTDLLDELVKVANVDKQEQIVAYLFGLQYDRISAPGCGNNLALLMALTSAANPEKFKEFLRMLPLLQGWRTEAIQSHVDKMSK